MHDSDAALDTLLSNSGNLDTADLVPRDRLMRVLNELAAMLRGYLENTSQGMLAGEYRPWKPLQSNCRVDADRVPLAREMVSAGQGLEEASTPSYCDASDLNVARILAC